MFAVIPTVKSLSMGSSYGLVQFTEFMELMQQHSSKQANQRMRTLALVIFFNCTSHEEFAVSPWTTELHSIENPGSCTCDSRLPCSQKVLFCAESREESRSSDTLLSDEVFLDLALPRRYRSSCCLLVIIVLSSAIRSSITHEMQ